MKKKSSRYGYELVAADLSSRIGKGEWPLGGRLPSVEALVGQYPYSHMTVFKALKHLEARGTIELRRGSGAYVAKTGRRFTVGMLFYDTILRAQKTPFNSLVLEAGQRWCEKQGAGTEVYITAHGRDELSSRDFTAALKNRTIDGFIALGVEPQLKAFFRSSFWRDHAVPYVNITDDTSFPATVSMGFAEEVEMAFRHVAALGVKTLDVVTGGHRLDAPCAARAASHGLALRVHAFPDDVRLGADPEEQFELFGLLVTEQLLVQAQRPEAILVLDDIMAKGVALGLFKSGVKVPDDVLFMTQANKGSGVFYPVPAVRLEFDPDRIVAAAGEMLWRSLTTGVPCAGNTRVLPELRQPDRAVPDYLAALISQLGSAGGLLSPVATPACPAAGARRRSVGTPRRRTAPAKED